MFYRTRCVYGCLQLHPIFSQHFLHHCLFYFSSLSQVSTYEGAKHMNLCILHTSIEANGTWTVCIVKLQNRNLSPRYPHGSSYLSLYPSWQQTVLWMDRVTRLTGEQGSYNLLTILSFSVLGHVCILRTEWGYFPQNIPQWSLEFRFALIIRKQITLPHLANSSK